MCSSGRSVSVVWVVVLVLSMVKNGMGEEVVVRATNSLEGNSFEGNLDLDIQCNIDRGPPITVKHGAYHQWKYSFDKEFECFFRWLGVSSGYHSFDMFVKSRDEGSNPCSWFIKQDGPCRFAPNGTSLCFHWKT
ncbi:hypothetical protein LR48_Vigan470s001000 [Vigna angularis]|uniref:S-protein homolog n=1 Tax=Phaseolus angularis TaxID=3914 RepID=A0A0L9TBS1_PHAAN|nr:hypothetical protein LR48_Vigan470s001000 [Vigna angularis]